MEISVLTLPRPRDGLSAVKRRDPVLSAAAGTGIRGPQDRLKGGTLISRFAR
jgi:hypothetical protein